jgi:glycosidase
VPQQYPPGWVQDAVFYQIFPDRFSRFGKKTSEDIVPWDSTPDNEHFQGGNLKGIESKLEYLLDLGVNAIYLNPIFSAGSVHRYDTWDYSEIDPRLGTMNDFRDLVDNAHLLDMKIILDGVFNHTGTGFFAFQDIEKNGPDSKYYNWYNIRRAEKKQDGSFNLEYDYWWNYPTLPKLNISNPDTGKYLLDIGEYWIKEGADGWRLDVPNEINDISFWKEFAERCRHENPDAYITAELWNKDFNFLEERNMDGEMEYELAYYLHGFFSGEKTNFSSVIETGFQDKIPILNGWQLSEKLNYLFREQSGLEWEIAKSCLTLLDSHDTARAATLNKDITTREMLYLALMTLPGAPMIYYGDEIGMVGGKDPDNRRAFPWGHIEKEGQQLKEHIKKYIARRKELPSLRRGSFSVLYAERDAIAWKREYEGEISLAGFNKGNEPVNLELHLGYTLNDKLGNSEQTTGKILIPPQSGILLSNR